MGEWFNWKLFASAFVAIFVAELGDKTQLTGFTLSASGGSRFSVWLGSCLALILSSTVAVFLGGLIGEKIPEIWLNRAAGLLFIGLGIWQLSGRG